MMAAPRLKLSTINVAGLRLPVKRAHLFTHFANSDYDIIALQETHCTNDTLAEWKTQWPGVSVWNTDSTRSAGVAILFHPNLAFELLGEDMDFNSRILRVTIKVNDYTFQILNLYAPNPHTVEESDEFFTSITQYLSPDLPTLICGDFNMVADVTKDRRGGHPRPLHSYGLTALNGVTSQYDLVDVWRTLYPSSRQFTWHSHHEQIHSRLDRIYVPTDWIHLVSASSHVHFVWSDHDMCTFTFSLPDEPPRGRGYWKLNIEYLDQPEYCTLISDFWCDWQGKRADYGDIQLWWDLGKSYIRSLSIEYARTLHLARQRTRVELETALSHARASDPVDLPTVTRIKLELKQLTIDKNAKLFAHTHTMLRDNHERPTKYFYDLLRERRNHNALSSLLDADGNLLSTQTEVMAETKRYYSELYSAEPNPNLQQQQHLLDNVTAQLSASQKLTLDSDLTLKELTHALSLTPNVKTAGYDGLPYEFYKTFWALLSQDFFDVHHLSLNDKPTLPYSQTTSLLTLLHKKADKRLLKNWRPLSLLNTDYKIVAKAISIRFEAISPTILSPTQTAHVPGRTVFENLFLTRDVLLYSEQKRIPGYLISIDQEKAFDKLNRDFLYRVLAKMNFGDRILKWIRTIYTDTIAHVLVNGFITSAFPLHRGVRQGCPLSAILFSIYIETLSLLLKNDPKIVPYPLPGSASTCIMQYADDTTLYLSYRTRLTDLFSALHLFQQATGSTINTSKTKGLLLGPPAPLDPLSHHIHWVNADGLHLLGITFFTDALHTQNFNWKARIATLHSYLTSLRTRTLSLRGKVLILNSIALAPFWHTATILPCPSNLEPRILSLLFNYLWGKDGQNPIQRKVIFLPLAQGGLGLKDPFLQGAALRLHQLRHIITPDSPALWVTLARYWLGLPLSALLPDWSFLRVNSFPKLDRALYPFYYRDVLLSLVTLPLASITWTTSYFYRTLLLQRSVIPPAWSSFWSTINHVTLSDMWQHVYTSYAPGKYQDVHFLFLHRVLSTNVFRKKRHKGCFNVNPLCSTCHFPETNEHVFFQCAPARALWHFIYPTICALLGVPSIRIFKLTLNIFDSPSPNSHKRLAITLIQIVFYQIWMDRCSTVFAKTPADRPHPAVSKLFITHNFAATLHTQYNIYIKQHTLAAFREKFCHTPHVCNVTEEPALIVTLLPE